MEDELYLEDSYLKECNATVTSVSDGKYVVLDHTIFHPKGGGQPWDTGKIIKEDETYKVVYVGKFSGEISHEVEQSGLEVGDEVHCVLDWDRRYKLMRSHTASHVFASLLCKGTGALATGNQLGVDRSRFDFSLEEYDPEIFEKYIQKSNELFKNNIPVKWYVLPREEALKISELTYLKDANLPDVPSIRIVEIEGVNKQACSGTHVRNLKEVGQIKMVKTKNKGRERRRVYFSLD